ncbi:MAG TPA: GMC family oxidoreductase N-terminal domain-containing protein [Stellaceae bacterium]|nr:GMC family oxidoreductase N-terminal domain-containing protein [Stellaceae bacterium]
MPRAEYNPLGRAASVRYMRLMAGGGYDTIIIGAGSAGCVLAARLGEDAQRRILVLEAGPADDHWLIHIPLGVGKVWNNPRWNWDYTGEPEPHIDQRRIYHPRGKVLGGSSSINIMAYVRCHRFDYDRLPQSGLRGWSYADVLPYFKRAESFAGGGNLYRGANGPLKTRRSPSEDPVYDAFVGAAPELGSAANDDYNAADQKGFGRLQHTIGNGKRCSTAVAYLRPAVARGNVTVETGAHVTRILIEGGRAVGVEYVANGARREARAEGEVILSAGAYNSPQLLMLSGIGPADELRALGIEPRVDLAGVGKNLWDHPMLATQWLRASQGNFHRGLRLDRLVPSMLQAHFLGTGFATELPGIGTAFVDSMPGLDAPDLQYFCGGGGFRAHEWFPLIHPPAPDVFGLTYCLLRQESRGQLTLASADPFAKARVFNNFLSTEYDRRAMRAGLKFAINAVEGTRAFAGLWGKRVLPAPEAKTDAELDAHIRANMTTIYHPAGTCRIGTDAAAVVDPEFRVRGVDRLRVIDASVMPEPVGGNLNAPVIMIAEKAADMIRGLPPLPAAPV